MRLALDIGLAGLALGIERVEFEIEIVLGRFAGSRSEGFFVRVSSSLRLCVERRDTAAMPMQTVRIGSPSLAPCQLMLDILQTIGTGAQPKEAGTAPDCAGDGPRDGGEACVESPDCVRTALAPPVRQLHVLDQEIACSDRTMQRGNPAERNDQWSSK